jgi:hypothetical protein
MSDPIEEWNYAGARLYETATEYKFDSDAVMALGRAGNSLVIALVEAREEIARLTASPPDSPEEK